MSLLPVRGRSIIPSGSIGTWRITASARSTRQLGRRTTWCSAAGKVSGACGASPGGLAWGWAAGVVREGSECLPGFHRALGIKECVCDPDDAPVRFPSGDLLGCLILNFSLMANCYVRAKLQVTFLKQFFISTCAWTCLKRLWCQEARSSCTAVLSSCCILQGSCRSAGLGTLTPLSPGVEDPHGALSSPCRLRLLFQRALQAAGAPAQPHAGEGGGVPHLRRDVRQQHQVLRPHPPPDRAGP